MWKTTLKNVLHNRGVVIGAAFVTGSALGSALSYHLTKTHLKTHYEEIAEREIREAKVFYGRLHKTTDDTDSPEKVLESTYGTEALEALRSYSGISNVDAPVETEDELIVSKESLESISVSAVDINADAIAPAVIDKSKLVQNLFETARRAVEPFDYEHEVPLRSDKKPYVITHDEYFSNEREYEQTHLTYFEGDDVLADENDVPLPTPDETVGEDNVVRFGYGSNDANLVYIRNEEIEMEFEITRSTGKYSVEVAGFDDPDELKHSERRFRTNRRRGDDE